MPNATIDELSALNVSPTIRSLGRRATLLSLSVAGAWTAGSFTVLERLPISWPVGVPIAILIFSGTAVLSRRLFMATVQQAEARAQEDYKNSVQVLRRLAEASSVREGECEIHLHRIGRLAEEIARELGLPEERAKLLYHAVGLHDVGKIKVDQAILLKPGKLTDSERTEVEEHVAHGAALLAGATCPLLKLAHQIVVTHHEAWAGWGYPRGLRGDEIPIEGRIAAVCDVFDAIVTDRPHRKRMTVEDAAEYIRLGAGSRFDPEVVEAFERCLPRTLPLYDPERDGRRPALI